MDKFAKLTGRQYKLFDYFGHPEAERVIVAMGSGAEIVARDRRAPRREGREGRPREGPAVPARSRSATFMAALPADACSTSPCSIARRSRARSASRSTWTSSRRSARREQAHIDRFHHQLTVIGGRYGLSSKEFTPAMVKAVYDELAKPRPKRHFTVGIIDDVDHTCRSTYDPAFDIEPATTSSARSSTASAPTAPSARTRTRSRSSARTRDNFAQGYFVYDSKKSGAVTISHLRFGPRPIRSPYLITQGELRRLPPVRASSRSTTCSTRRSPGATFLLNSPVRPGRGLGRAAARGAAADHRQEAQVLRDRRVQGRRETGMGVRINTIMQTCFFAISGVLPREEAIDADQEGDQEDLRPQGRGGRPEELRRRRHTLAHLYEVTVPRAAGDRHAACRRSSPRRRRTS